MAKHFNESGPVDSDIDDPNEVVESAESAEATEVSEPGSEPVESAAPEPVVNPTPEPTPEPQPKPVQMAIVSGATAAFTAAVEGYMDAMDPKRPMKATEGVKHQRMFRMAVIGALSVESDEQAVANARYLLDMMDADESRVFSIAYLFRFFDSREWKSPAERREIETILTLFQATAKKETRGAEARKLDWGSIGRYLVPKHQQLILGRLKRVYGL